MIASAASAATAPVPPRDAAGVRPPGPDVRPLDVLRAIQDAKVPRVVSAVGHALLRRVDSKSWRWPKRAGSYGGSSVADLASLARYSRRHTARALRWMETQGLITTIFRPWTVSEYILHPQRWLQFADEASGADDPGMALPRDPERDPAQELRRQCGRAGAHPKRLRALAEKSGLALPPNWPELTRRHQLLPVLVRLLDEAGISAEDDPLADDPPADEQRAEDDAAAEAVPSADGRPGWAARFARQHGQDPEHFAWLCQQIAEIVRGGEPDASDARAIGRLWKARDYPRPEQLVAELRLVQVAALGCTDPLWASVRGFDRRGQRVGAFRARSVSELVRASKFADRLQAGTRHRDGRCGCPPAVMPVREAGSSGTEPMDLLSLDLEAIDWDADVFVPPGQEGVCIIRDHDLQAAWAEAQRSLAESLGRLNYTTWIEPLAPLRVHGGVFVVAAPNRYYRDWVVANHLDRIQAVIGGPVGFYVPPKASSVGQLPA